MYTKSNSTYYHACVDYTLEEVKFPDRKAQIVPPLFNIKIQYILYFKIIINKFSKQTFFSTSKGSLTSLLRKSCGVSL